MTRAQVIAAYRRAAELARAEGVTVEFHPGWTTRGRDGFRPLLIVEHDTSDPVRLSHSRMLDILVNGHGAIAGNAICNDAVLDDGRIVVIASGLAWHGGAGTWDGIVGLNPHGLGTEYQRHANGQLTPRQLEVGRIWTRARNAAFTIPIRRVCEHGESATPRGRKIDRSLRRGVRLSGADWRRSLTPPTPPPRPAPAPAPPPPLQEDIMASIADLRAAIRETVPPLIDAAIADLATGGAVDGVSGKVTQARDRTNEAIRLAQATATAAVARLRAEVGLDTSPESDLVQVAYLRHGRGGQPYTWADLERRLRDAAAAGERSAPPADPPVGADAD